MIPEAAGIVVGLLTTRYTVNMIQTVAEGAPPDYMLVLWLLSANIMVYLFSILQKCIIAMIRIKVKLYFESSICNKLPHIKWEYFESFETGQTVENVTNKTYNALINSHNHLCNYILDIFQMIIFIYFLLSFQWAVIILYFAVLIVSITISNRVFKSNYTIWEQIIPLQKRQNYERDVMSNVDMHQESQHNRMLAWSIARWKKLYNKEYRLRLKIFKRYELVMQLSRLIMNLPYIVMLIYSSVLVMQGKQDVGLVLMYFNMFNQIVNLFGMVESAIFEDQVNIPFVFDYKKVMSWEEQRMGTSPSISDAIEFLDIHYRYPQSERDVLNGISIKAKLGEKIAIVGKNGSGKTTFSLIVMGIIENISNGKIVIDGIDNKCLSLESVQCIHQNFEQYHLTIKENIMIGRKGADMKDSEVSELLTKVGMYDFVSSLPKGMNTSLGQLTEDGIELSKGQWQRLAIARLLANKDAKIWILDEPTAYLDPLAEIEIYNLVHSLAENKLVFFISHRLGFARNTNRILLFENGQLVGDASHNNLIKTSPLYSEMYQAQQKWYI